MLTAFIDRIAGFLRPDHVRDATKMMPSERDRAPMISPITIGLLEALGVRHALAVQYAPLLAIAAHRYRIDATARRIARRPEDIANLTYASRLGNGSAGSGDGWRYRGRGLIQITGRSSYAASGLVLDLDLLEHPEQLEHPYTAALSAAEWWHRHGCNQRADTGDLADVTRRVNGGLTGLDDRLKLYAGAMTYIGSA